MTDVKKMLDNLANYEDKKTLINLQKQELIDTILTDEIKQAIKEIDAEFSSKFEAADDNISSLRASIKDAVLSSGEKVKGEYLQAVYMKGRHKWDTKGLKGYAKAYPEVNEFYTAGNPSVSIRKT